MKIFQIVEFNKIFVQSAAMLDDSFQAHLNKIILTVIAVCVKERELIYRPSHNNA